MKNVLLLGGPYDGQRVEVHGTMTSTSPTPDAIYKVVPMCSHGEVHWFGVLDGADPLALLIAGYAPAPKPDTLAQFIGDRVGKGLDAWVADNALTGGTTAPADCGFCECGRPGRFS